MRRLFAIISVRRIFRNRRVPKERESRLDPYKAQIQAWLDGDNNVWYKQRHTAQRIYDRLCNEHRGFNLSYPTVQRYVKATGSRRKGSKYSKSWSGIPAKHR